MSDDFDFGFTAVDDIPTSTTTTSEPVQATLPEGSLDAVMDKLEQLEARILSADNTGMINEHRALLEADVTGKLKDVETMILPLLQNLKKNPEKDYIHWPNRAVIIDKQIEKILSITRYFERI